MLAKLAMHVNLGMDPETQIAIYCRMTLIKQNDEHIRRVIKSGRLVTPYYSPRGQEVIPSAVSAALNADDYICTIYRGIHDMLAKGVPLNELWAEIAGRVDGTSKGKGGGMHITHPESGAMLTTGIVGSSMPIANGLAWSSQLCGDRKVTVAYFGDGASNIGAFHESLNLASIWKLPVIFICQNNRYAEHTSYQKGTSVARISDRAGGYGMPGINVDGNDPFAMYAAAREAIERARAGEGPTLIEAMTFRFFGHLLGDADGYMDKMQKQAAMDADPVARFRARLIETGISTADGLAAIEAKIDNDIRVAIEFALESAFPALTEMEADVYENRITQ